MANALPVMTHAGGDELDTKTDGQLLTWLTAAERALGRQPVNVTAELRAARTFHDDSLTAASATRRNAEAAEKAGEDAWAQVHADTADGLDDEAARAAVGSRAAGDDPGRLRRLGSHGDTHPGPWHRRPGGACSAAAPLRTTACRQHRSR